MCKGDFIGNEQNVNRLSTAFSNTIICLDFSLKSSKISLCFIDFLLKEPMSAGSSAALQRVRPGADARLNIHAAGSLSA